MSEGRLVANRYRLDRALGGGGMSAVWEAEDLELGRRVAVKLLARDADPARFEREARAAASLAHPNVCLLYDYGESGDGPFMVLELLTGGSLEDRLRAGPIADAETERIALAIAAGLAHAHENGLVHRDLKPANILFDAEDRPKIADFGIVRAAGAGTLTEAGTVLGTALTISPEQAAGEPAGPASDVYAFGVVLFWMLAGRPPFEGAEAMAIVDQHLHDTPPPLSELRPDAPARLESLAMAALVKDPRERPPDGSALVAELTAAGAAAATAVVPPPPRSRRGLAERALVLAAAILLLALAGGLFALVATRTSEPDPANPSPPVADTTREGTTAEEETPPAETEPATTTEESTTSAGETTAPATTETEPPATTTTVGESVPATTATEPPATATTEPPTTTATAVTTGSSGEGDTG